MLDIGANIGSHCLQFIRDREDLKIWAFELHHENFSLLKENCKPYFNIKCFNVGVGSNTSVVTYNDGHASNSGVVKLDSYGNNDNIVIAIDDLKIEEKISFIKIDIEGHELSAFEGMKNTLLKHKPMIWVEDLNNNAVNYLEGLGYNIIKSKEETFDFLMEMK
jgi:FkbM family methyltransferase